jgi:type IV pilus assembly protein PilC
MATAGKDEKAKKEGPKELNFSWEGKNKQGKVVRGEMKAASEAAAGAALRRQGISVTKLKKQKTGGGGSVTDKDITLFSRQLATMVKSGVPLLQSFDIVGKGTSNPALAKLLFSIKSEVETGASLATAFRKYPMHFRRPLLQPGRGRRTGGYSRHACWIAWRRTKKKSRRSSRRSRAP